MLSDAQIGRWGRQILLPEVGGRGQERLLASRIALGGAGAALERAADLIGRAGAHPVGTGDPAAAVAVLLDANAESLAGLPPGMPAVAGRIEGKRAILVVLTGAPCPHCAAPAPHGAPEAFPRSALGLVAAHALAALAATEALLVALAPGRPSRRYTLDLGTGACESAALAATPCPHCPPRT